MNRGISGTTKVTGRTLFSQIDDETVRFIIDKVKEYHEIDIPYLREMKQVTRDRFQVLIIHFILLKSIF